MHCIDVRYTLWNAEYRISLTRNLEISTENSKNMSNCQDQRELSNEDKESEEDRDTAMSIEDLESRGPQVFSGFVAGGVKLYSTVAVEVV